MPQLPLMIEPVVVVVLGLCAVLLLVVILVAFVLVVILVIFLLVLTLVVFLLMGILILLHCVIYHAWRLSAAHGVPPHSCRSLGHCMPRRSRLKFAGSLCQRRDRSRRALKSLCRVCHLAG